VVNLDDFIFGESGLDFGAIDNFVIGYLVIAKVRIII